tara:strand:- start:153 stop:1019 length:867 start_codon:yes stop_codon:yes gene_type:complete
MSNLKNPFAPFDKDLNNALEKNVSEAILEDFGKGDATTKIIAKDKIIKAKVVSREYAVLCGTPWFDAVLKKIDPKIKIIWNYCEGDIIETNTELCEISSSAKSLLSAERTALNFLQFLSGVATLTLKYVKKISGTNVIVLDTRKTVPGLRLAQKYAVRVGGGANQRLSLNDGILIKENHIFIFGSISESIKGASLNNLNTPIQIEVENLIELNEAIEAGAKSIILDNFSIDNILKAVKISNNRVQLEVSGGVNLDNIKLIAETGVDRISVGELTKNIKSIDFSLRFLN